MLTKTFTIQIFLFIIPFYSEPVSSENILTIAFWSTKSHRITYQPLLEALAAKGHNVTIVSPVPSKPTHQNIHELESDNFEAFIKTSDSVPLENVFEMKERRKWNIPTHFIHLVIDICRHTLNQPHVNALLSQKFDLVLVPILYNECSAAFAHKLNVSTILISPISVVGQISSLYGNPSPTSFVPNAFTGYSDQMGLYERTVNFLMEGLIRAIYNYIFIPGLEQVYREVFNDPTFPSMDQILLNSSIILSNSHFSLSKPRPWLPDIVEVGGMHCRQANPLPKDLADFVESSGSDGFILFSMGSTVSASDMSADKRTMFVQAFGKLKQKVLWKWELDSIPNLPANVKLSKWLPQQDLLGHPKIKAFITHGGFGSTTESACHGVPLVGIPIFADQTLNMATAEKEGLAVTVDFATVTVDSLVNQIQRVINSPTYKLNAQHLSQRLLDQPTKALDRAVYWTEYVMKHQGATHLRSAGRDLNFFHYHSLDVIGFLVVTLLTTLVFSFVTVRYIFKKLWNFTFSNNPPVQSELTGTKYGDGKKRN